MAGEEKEGDKEEVRVKVGWRRGRASKGGRRAAARVGASLEAVPLPKIACRARAHGRAPSHSILPALDDAERTLPSSWWPRPNALCSVHAVADQ